MINIYIETSQKPLKRQNGIACLILENPENKGNTVTIFGKTLEKTKYEAELISLKIALNKVKKGEKLIIWTECNMLAAVFERKWLEKWKENSWKTAKRQNVKHCEVLMEIYEILAGNYPEINHKKPHEYKMWMKKEVKERKERHEKEDQRESKSV